MNETGPVTLREGQRVLNDVGAKLAIWQAALDERRAEAVSGFRDQIAGMVVPDGVSRADYVEAQADIVIDRWCQQRGAFSREIVAMLDHNSVRVVQKLGIPSELGSLLGLHLDTAVRDLNRRLRRNFQPD